MRVDNRKFENGRYVKNNKPIPEKVFIAFDSKELDLLQDTYYGQMQKTRFKYQCRNCGYIGEKYFRHLKKGGGCLSCSKRASSGEQAISKFLKDHGIDFIKEYTFKDLRDKKRLRFDFAIFYEGRLVLLVEFDGLQHSKAVDYFGGKEALEGVRYRDNLKTAYCQSKGIPLLRIKHNQVKAIPKILGDYLSVKY